MGKRILAICCTPYQLLVAAQVLACYYPGEEADLILSDQMSGARKLWEQAKDIWPYGQVYYLEERRLNRLAHKENAKNILLGAVAPEKLLERFQAENGQISQVDICGECDPKESTKNYKNDQANRIFLDFWKKWLIDVKGRETL